MYQMSLHCYHEIQGVVLYVTGTMTKSELGIALSDMTLEEINNLPYITQTGVLRKPSKHKFSVKQENLKSNQGISSFWIKSPKYTGQRNLLNQTTEI